MKALTLQQPWAGLIIAGRKTIETRTWNTKFRGVFYIHAGKTIDKDACKRLDIDPGLLITGAIIGKARLTDTKKYRNEEEFLAERSKHMVYTYDSSKPKYGFILKDIKRIKPIPYKGMLNFFDVK